MDNQPAEQKKSNNLILFLLLLVFVLLALGGSYWWYQQSVPHQLVPPTYKKVAADATNDVQIVIKNDAAGMFFEWNGIRLSPTQRITGLVSGTQYTFGLTNNTQTKEGIFIPALTKNVVINPGQYLPMPISFSSPGTYYFLGNIYQPGWAGLKSGFEVDQ